MDERPVLMVNEGELTGQRWTLGDEPMVIGRGNDSDIVLPERQVSRHHLKILYHDGRYLLDTSNGSLTADATREEIDEVLWRWLERVVTRIMEEAEWYVDAGSSNFSGLYDECKRSVRREREQARTSDDHRSAPA